MIFLARSRGPAWRIDVGFLKDHGSIDGAVGSKADDSMGTANGSIPFRSSPYPTFRFRPKSAIFRALGNTAPPALPKARER